MGISKVVDELISAYLKSPKSGVGVFDGRFRNDPLAMVITHEVPSWMFVAGQGPWSFQSIREFLRKIVLSGLWALPMPIWRVYIFFGGRGKKRCPKNIISQSSHRWCSKLNHAFVTSQKKMHDFEISLPTTTIAWLKLCDSFKARDDNWLCPFEWSKYGGFLINHPFWGTPIFPNTRIESKASEFSVWASPLHLARCDEFIHWIKSPLSLVSSQWPTKSMKD